jgi:hypothetical protein
VQDALLVRGGQAGAELPGDHDCLVMRKAPNAPQQRGQVLPVHVLHRKELLAVGLDDVVHPAHVGVRHLPGELDLAKDAVEPSLVPV